MKETGVVRRIDELGRVVIPKGIRKNLRIREGDSIEIFIENDDKIVLQKHSTFKGLGNDFDNLAKTLYEVTKNTTLISDKEVVIASFGKLAGQYRNQPIAPGYRTLLNARRVTHESIAKITDATNEKFKSYVIPLIVQGDIYGSICILEDTKPLEAQDKAVVDAMSRFFVKQLEV